MEVNEYKLKESAKILELSEVVKALREDLIQMKNDPSVSQNEIDEKEQELKD